MEKINEIINEKYYWCAELKLSLLWADVAEKQGCDQIEIVGYLMEKVMGYKKQVGVTK